MIEQLVVKTSEETLSLMAEGIPFDVILSPFSVVLVLNIMQWH